MGFRASAFLGFVSGGNLCSAAQNSLVTNETANQTQREQETTRSQWATRLSPATFQLKTYQLRKLPRSGEEKTSQSLQVAQARLSSEKRKTDPAAEVLLVQGPKLNLSNPDPVIFQVVKRERPVPAPAETRSVRCGEEKVAVAVKKNFLGNSQLIQPNDLSLGELQGCGSTVTISIQLIHDCHCVCEVTGCLHLIGLMVPTLPFHLLCMFVMASNVVFVRETMHVEAAAMMQGYHVPLRVFVDSCVYSFIGNHECLTDSKLTGAQFYFMPRSQEDKLHFQLKAFKFKHDDRSEFYITCHLNATTVSVPVDSQHKACSFLTEAGRWVASGGDNKVCSCYEASCSGQVQRRSPAADAGTLTEPIIPAFSFLCSLSQPLTHLCGAGVAHVVMVSVSTLVCSRLHKPAGHSVCT
uniref:ZP-C domain-containing protein n=1 Tax=Poecilia mexicana TaxID=48701 RepID=A0A3B3X142_9TELE